MGYYQYNGSDGNEASMEEVGGFKGFAKTFYNADQYIEYLMYDDYENIDDTARDLVDRLRVIAQRYGGVSKMKKDYEDGNVPMSSNEYRNGLESLTDLPSPGDVYVNQNGVECEIMMVDEPPLNEEYRIDNFQITYKLGNQYPECHRWGWLKKVLSDNYYASTKKSVSKVDFKSAFDKQVAKNRGVKKYNTEAWHRISAVGVKIADLRHELDGIKTMDISDEMKQLIDTVIGDLNYASVTLAEIEDKV